MLFFHLVVTNCHCVSNIILCFIYLGTYVDIGTQPPHTAASVDFLGVLFRVILFYILCNFEINII